MNCPPCHGPLSDPTLHPVLMKPVEFGPPVGVLAESPVGHLGCVMDWAHDQAEDRWLTANPQGES